MARIFVPLVAFQAAFLSIIPRRLGNGISLKSSACGLAFLALPALTACGSGRSIMVAPIPLPAPAPQPQPAPALQPESPPSPLPPPPPASPPQPPDAPPPGQQEAPGTSDVTLQPRVTPEDQTGNGPYQGATPRYYDAPGTPISPWSALPEYSASQIDRYIGNSLESWGSNNPADYLDDTKMQFQPGLVTVNAHSAYARGLSGKDVRVAIEDNGVDVTRREFAGRVRSAGSAFTYWRPAAYVEAVEVFSRCEIPFAGCRVYEVDSGGDPETIERFATAIVQRHGYPTENDQWFIRDISRQGGEEHLAWYEVPALYERDIVGDFTRAHGTRVASVAAGGIFGAAPGAILVPIAQNFDEQWELQMVGQGLLEQITRSPEETARWDPILALATTESNRAFDIINRSYGIPAGNVAALIDSHASEEEGERWLQANLPQTWSATLQTNVPASDRVIEVWAAGNESLPAPSAEAARALRWAQARGLNFAVSALAPSGTIAGYSNRCGPLPDDWNAARHGRHYCLAAPGTVNAENPGRVIGQLPAYNIQGTSFAAPLVSGGLALMMEAFRNQLSPREIGLRLVNTANNRGIYSDLLVYGAGVMDLDAATRPVGTTRTGTPLRQAAFADTYVATPSAWGDVGARLGGLEVAAFDEWNAPFWYPLGSRIGASGTYWVPPVPERQAGVEQERLLPHLAWTGGAQGASEGRLKLRFTAGAAPGYGDTRPLHTFGLSAEPFIAGLRLGLVAETKTNQGAAPSGAFGDGVMSSLVFATRKHEWALGAGPFMAEASWLLGGGHADYPRGTMLQATPALYSSGSAALVHRGEGHESRLQVAQPLRAESGTGTLTMATGRTREGRRLHACHSFALEPDARELRLSLRHDRKAGKGAFALEIGHVHDAGHVRGRTSTFAGGGYRLQW